jgi:aminopeptidase N/puromycin-sensitive aminopeptidase
MVEDYVGAETFRKGVNLYLKEHAYGNATAEDFWNAVARVSGKPVDKIMSSFIDQPGAPLISVRTRCSGSSMVAEVAQQRFYSNSHEIGSSPNQHWVIPVCFRVGKGAAQDCRILDKPQQEFQFAQCSSDVTANANGSGYYRTAYAPDVLEKLPAPDWTPAERVRLVGDTWALVRSGQKSAADYLALLDRMGPDPERVVLETQIGPLNTIGTYLVDASEKEQFAGFLRQFIGPTVKRLGWKPNPGEGDQIRELRPQLINLLGRFANDPELLQQAQQVANQYLNDRSSVDASIVPIALGLAGRTGGADLYQRYVDAMKSSKSPEEYLNFFFALSSFADPTLVQRTIEMTISPDVRSQDAPNLISVMLRNPETQQLTWELTKQHWPDIDKKLTISSGGRIVAAAGAFCNSASREDVSQFFSAHTVASSERTFKQTLNQIDSCIDLRAQQQDKLAKWLGGPQGSGSGSGSGVHAGAAKN